MMIFTLSVFVCPSSLSCRRCMISTSSLSTTLSTPPSPCWPWGYLTRSVQIITAYRAHMYIVRTEEPHECWWILCYCLNLHQPVNAAPHFLIYSRMFLTRGAWSILNCTSPGSSTSSSTRESSSSASPRASTHQWCCFLSPVPSCPTPLRAPGCPSPTTRPLRSPRQQPWSLWSAYRWVGPEWC